MNLVEHRSIVPSSKRLDLAHALKYAKPDKSEFAIQIIKLDFGTWSSEGDKAY